MKVLVTGGAGYLGTELVASLCRRSDVSEVVVYDNLSRGNYNLFIGSKLPDKPIRMVLGDILDTRRLRWEVNKADVVFHLAARVTTPFADARYHELEQVNHWGSAELSYLLEEQPVELLVYVSSCSIYGDRKVLANATSTPQPDTAYALSKLRGERMLERLTDRMPVIVARCANVYGYSESMRFDAVVNRFVLDAHLTGKIQIHGSGEQSRAFIHVKNAASVLAGLINGQLESGTYNLVERNLKILEVALAVKHIYPNLEMLFTEQDMRRRNLRVARDPRLFAGGKDEDSGFLQQIEACRNSFSFQPLRPGTRS